MMKSVVRSTCSMTLTWVKFNFCPCKCKIYLSHCKTYYHIQVATSWWIEISWTARTCHIDLLDFVFNHSPTLFGFQSISRACFVVLYCCYSFEILWHIFCHHHFIFRSFLVSLVLLPQVVHCLGTTVYLHSLAENTSPIESPQVHKRPPS